MIISIDADHMVYRHPDTLADDAEKLQALYDENRVILRIGGVLRRAEVYDWVGNSKHPVSFPLGWCRVDDYGARFVEDSRGLAEAIRKYNEGIDQELRERDAWARDAAPVADAVDRANMLEPFREVLTEAEAQGSNRRLVYLTSGRLLEAAIERAESLTSLASVEQVNEALRLISQVEPALRVAAAGRIGWKAECERLRARVAELEGEAEDWKRVRKRVSLDLEALMSALGFQWSALGFQWEIDEARRDLLPRKGTNTD
jgi:hypothetical protein